MALIFPCNIPDQCLPHDLKHLKRHIAHVVINYIHYLSECINDTKAHNCVTVVDYVEPIPAANVAPFIWPAILLVAEQGTHRLEKPRYIVEHMAWVMKHLHWIKDFNYQAVMDGLNIKVSRAATDQHYDAMSAMLSAANFEDLKDYARQFFAIEPTVARVPAHVSSFFGRVCHAASALILQHHLEMMCASGCYREPRRKSPVPELDEATSVVAIRHYAINLVEYVAKWRKDGTMTSHSDSALAEQVNLPATGYSTSFVWCEDHDCFVPHISSITSE